MRRRSRDTEDRLVAELALAKTQLKEASRRNSCEGMCTLHKSVARQPNVKCTCMRYFASLEEEPTAEKQPAPTVVLLVRPPVDFLARGVFRESTVAVCLSCLIDTTLPT